jgi:hypothetical protein
MPPTTSNDLIISTKWDGTKETHDGYKTWMNEVSLWANNNDMAWIMKIAKRLQEAPNFRRPVSESHLWARSFSRRHTPLARNSSPRFSDPQKLT